ncbi:MAG: FHA domain-containing protein, partial [Oscillospiraceae bacterium]|nr:FHA domain-containing protein [Oscillospiraceae bacterium]
MSGLAEKLAALDMSVLSWVSFFIRFLLPILGVIILERCVRSLLREKYESEEWGQLILPNNARIPLNHWENIIGRSAASDVLMDYPTVSRSHSALIRNDKGEWTLYDLESKGGVELNGRRIVESAPIKSGDVVSLAGVELVFVSMSRENERQQAKSRRKPGRIVRQGRTLAVLTELQILLAVQLCIAAGDELTLTIPAAFAGLGEE